MPRLALVVPDLSMGGGVRTVAQFIRDVALEDGTWEVKPISLCTSSSNEESTCLHSPRTWRRGVQVGQRSWQGAVIPHVGASLGELEFQRYRPRRALSGLLADCDVVQVVCGSPAWANAVIGLGKPVALQVATRARVERRMRDANPRSLAAWWRKGMTTVTDRLDDRALRNVDAIQVESPWMLDYASSLNSGRMTDVRYAPPGIDVVRFHPLVPFARVHDASILCVGRLDDPRKNIALLLQAYARLPEGVRANTPLVLAGSGAPPALFWQQAETSGVRERIRFVEKPSDAELIDLYQHAGVFALPSDEEGFGMVLLEAMACGVPVLATRCGGPDGIITDGKDGYLVPLGDAEALSASLLHLLKDPVLNIEMGAAARETVVQRFERRLAGQVFVDMWERLLRKGT